MNKLLHGSASEKNSSVKTSRKQKETKVLIGDFKWEEKGTLRMEMDGLTPETLQATFILYIHIYTLSTASYP